MFSYFFMLQQKLRQFAKLGLLGTASFSVIAFYRGEPKFYSNVSCNQEITILLGLNLCFNLSNFLQTFRSNSFFPLMYFDKRLKIEANICNSIF